MNVRGRRLLRRRVLERRKALAFERQTHFRDRPAIHRRFFRYPFFRSVIQGFLRHPAGKRLFANRLGPTFQQPRHQERLRQDR